MSFRCTFPTLHHTKSISPGLIYYFNYLNATTRTWDWRDERWAAMRRFVIATSHSNLDHKVGTAGTHMYANERHTSWYNHHFDYLRHRTRHEILPPNCQHMNHGSMTLFSARGQILSTPSPIFSSVPPPSQSPPTFLLSHKWASLLYQKQTGSLEEGQNYYLSHSSSSCRSSNSR